MATRYGKPCSIEEEILEYLRHLPAGVPITRWDITDWVVEVRGVTCTREELTQAIESIERRYRTRFPEGSFEEALTRIYCTTPEEILEEAVLEDEYGPDLLSKLEELELLRARSRAN